MPEQKQVSFLSWKDLGFLLSLTFLSVPNEDLAWIHASFLFALVTLVLAVGQGNARCLSGDVGAGLRPGRP